MAYMKITLHTNYINTDEFFLFELPVDWDEMTDQQKDEYEYQCWQDAVASFVDGRVDILEGDIEEDEDY